MRLDQNDQWGTPTMSVFEASQIKTVDMPLYQSIKQVRAAKIVFLYYQKHDFGDLVKYWDVKEDCRPQNEEGSWGVVLDIGDAKVTEAKMFVAMSIDFYKRHRPQVGGWLVEYDEGYKSYSPAKAFEPCHVRLGDVSHQFDDITTDLPAALSTLFRMAHVLSIDDAWNAAVGSPAGSDASARNSYLNRFKTYCKNLWLPKPDKVLADSYNKDLAAALEPVPESK